MLWSARAASWVALRVLIYCQQCARVQLPTRPLSHRLGCISITEPCISFSYSYGVRRHSVSAASWNSLSSCRAAPPMHALKAGGALLSWEAAVQGKCTTQPDPADFPGMNGVPLVATTTGQCFLLAHDDMLGVVTPKFWADNLYLRAALPARTKRIFHFPALVVVPPLATSTAAVYLTNMIFQGDGDGSAVGIAADDKVYVRGAPRPVYVCVCVAVGKHPIKHALSLIHI